MTATLLALDNLTMDAIQLAHLEPNRLAGTLRAAAGQSSLGPAEQRIHDLLLETACIHIIDFFTKRPEFAARTAVEHSRALGTLLDRTGPADVRSFERQLRDGLLTKLDTMHLFGLQLPADEQTYQLSTAYVNLSVQAAGDQAMKAGPRVEDVLAGNRRMLLEGPAGAGKTTLLRRLAVHALRGDLPPQLASWGEPIPFVLQLRSFIRGDTLELPYPQRFVAAVAPPLAGKEPDGWLDDLLQDGSVLVLIDGVDEVQEKYRDDVFTWIQELIRFYPHPCYVLTSRPAAISARWRDWLRRGLKFAQANLEPMTRAQVDDFIGRWHDTAAATTSDADTLTECATALRDALARRRDLARLATSPLLCAMLCALNRTNNQYLPHGRNALYQDALTMLLDRRDAEQRISTSPIRLGREQLQPLLSRLAIWMTMNGRRTIPLDRAQALIDELLPRIQLGRRDVVLSAEDVLRHLLERSGLLEQPTVELLEFRHPSFQDYLGAIEIFQQDHLAHLLRNAHDPLYHDIAIMATAQTQNDPDRQRRLLTGLIARADRDEEHSRQLWLLAAACIADVGMVDPAISDRIHTETERLLPPKDLSETDSIFRAGAFVLDLLAEAAQRREFTDGEAAATIRIAAKVGVDEALPLLRRFCKRRSFQVQAELAAAWTWAVDPARFVDEVLADATVGPYFPLFRADLLSLLGGITNITGIELLCDMTRVDLDMLVESAVLRTRVTAVRFAVGMSADVAERLGVLAALPQLRSLTIRVAAIDLAVLAGLSGLELLSIDSAERLDLRPLARLPRLRHLSLVDCDLSDWSTLSALRNLRSLYIRGAGPADLTPIAGLTELRKLDIRNTKITDLRPLAHLTKLEIVS